MTHQSLIFGQSLDFYNGATLIIRTFDRIEWHNTVEIESHDRSDMWDYCSSNTTTAQRHAGLEIIHNPLVI